MKKGFKGLSLFMLALIMIPCAAILVACGEVRAESVTLDKTTLTLDIGQVAQLTATVLPENTANKDVEWSTSNAGNATVSTTGLVTAVAPGSATITVKADNDKTATCTVTVSSNVYGYSTTVHAGEKIQDAINAAQDGDRILVKAGTYNEQLIIDKDVEIVGDGEVVIAGPADYTNLQVVEREAADTSLTGNMYGVVVVKNASATLKNITVKGNPDQAGAHAQLPWQRYTGVLSVNADLTLDGVKIQDVRLAPGTQGLDQMSNAGYGVLTAGANAGNLVVKNCEIKGFQKGGIYALTPNSAVEITDNVIEGTSNNQKVAQNGIYVVSENAVVTGNTLKNLQYTNPEHSSQWSATGIIVNCKSSVAGVEAANTFENAQTKVDFQYDDFYRNDGSVFDWGEVPSAMNGVQVTDFEGGKVWGIKGNGAEVDYAKMQDYTTREYNFDVSYDIYPISSALTGTTIGGGNVIGLDVGIRDRETGWQGIIPVFGAAQGGKVKVTRHPSNFDSATQIDGNTWYTVSYNITSTANGRTITLTIKNRATGATVYTQQAPITIDGCVYTNIYYPNTASNTPVAYIDNYKIYASARDVDNVVTAGGDIQQAINQAEEGSIILVKAGTYAGDITVNKTISLIGEGAILTGKIKVTANNVFMKGFNVRHTYPAPTQPDRYPEESYFEITGQNFTLDSCNVERTTGDMST